MNNTFLNLDNMNKSKIHIRHYWIRHKDGHLFCGICKKKQDEPSLDKESKSS